MPNIQAVQSTQHEQHSWLPFSHYRFAACDAYAPLLVQEFLQAGATAPIAFTKSAEGYRPIFVMGLRPSQNLLVSSQTGKWRGDYVPAYYRSHPFCLAKDQHGKTLLSFHSDSETVFPHKPPGSQVQPFFVAGELSAELRRVHDFLTQVEAGRRATAEFCNTVAQLELFCPWETQAVAVTQALKVKGLHRIDEKKLRALPADSAKALLETGALGAIYHHLGSLQHTQKLLTLTQGHSHGADKAAEVLPASLTHADADELVALDWAAIVSHEP